MKAIISLRSIPFWFIANLFLAITFSLETPIRAQSLRSSEIHFDHLTENQGLSSNAVRKIFQDSKGFLWIATEGGIDRYDGIRFKHYQLDGAQFPSDRKAFCIFEDHAGNLWAGGYTGSLNRFDAATNSFRKIANLPSSLAKVDLLNICADENGILWLGTNRGLLRYDQAGNKADLFVPDTDNTLIHSSVKDSQGQLWVGTPAGLLVFDRVSGTFERVFLSSQGNNDSHIIVLSLLEYPSGTLLVGTNLGLYAVNISRRSLDTEVSYAIAHLLPSGGPDINSLFALSNNAILVGVHGGGVAVLDLESKQVEWIRHDPQRPESLAGNLVRDFLLDRSGVLWVADDIAGISKYSLDKLSFRLYRNDPFDDRTLSGNYTRGICEAHDGAIWVCTQFNGLNRVDPVTGISKRYVKAANKIPYDETYSVLEDHEGDVWVGFVTRPGLARLDRNTDRFVSFSLFPSFGVNALFEDTEGTLWVGTTHGVFEIPRNRRSVIPHPEFLKPVKDLGLDDIQSLLVERNGNLWIGLDSHLITVLRSNGAAIDRSSALGTLAPETLLCAFLETDNYIWIATKGAGVYQYDRNTNNIAPLRLKEGLLHQNTYGILQDRKGKLWISSDNGIVKYDPIDQSLVPFSPNQGLQGKEFNRNSYCLTSNGTMYFGGTQGMNGFSPEFVETKYRPPVVAISGLYVNGVPVAPLNQINLNYTQNTLTIELAVLDYNSPDLNQFQVKLEGLNHDWITLSETPQIVYTNLQPGTYKLRAKGSNSSGVWGEASIQLSILISPPWWRTWWAYGIYFLLAFGLIGGVGTAVRYRTLIQSKLLEAAATAKAALLEKETEHQRAKTAELLRLKSIESEAIIRTKNEQLAELVENLKKSEEKALKATRAKSEFLASISHEIRTPLNAVLGMAYVLLRTNLNDTQRNYAQTINVAGAALMGLVDDVLDISKIEAGVFTLNMQPLDLRLCILECVELLRHSAAEKQIELRCSIDDIPSTVVSDASRLRQVLTNLLNNAVKFTDQGWVLMHVAARPVEKRGQAGDFYEIRFEVRDTGIGIAEENLSSLFKVFSQVDTSISRRYGGTGLGLAISKGIVDAMGGTLEVESEVGVGTTFRTSIVVESIADSAHAHANEHQEKLSTDSSKALTKILVADDSALNRYVIGQILESFGYAAEFRSTGREVIDAMSLDQFDLVIIDVHMPEIDGIEVTRRIRGMAQHSDTRIIGLTADVMSTTRDQCLEAGMDDILTKPIAVDRLYAFLNNAEIHTRPQQTNDNLVLNHDIVLQLRTSSAGATGKSFAELVNLFIHLCEETLVNLDDSFMRGEFKEVSQHAHKLAGASATLGAEKMASACRVVQNCATTDGPDSVKESLNVLRQEYSLLLNELRNPRVANETKAIPLTLSQS